MGRKKNLPLLENIEVIDIADKGKAVAKHGDLVIFVRDLVPGDVADIQLVKKRRSHAEAIPVTLKKESADRVTPFCPHFNSCGGCKWQHLSYEKQVYFKQKQVQDQLTRLGELDLPQLSPAIPSVKTRHYRNKLEYSFSNKRWLEAEEIQSGEEIKDMNGLGFHVPGKFDRVLDIQECFLQEPFTNDVRNFINTYAKETGITYYDYRAHTGLLRNLVIRNTTKDEWMLNLVVNEMTPEIMQLLFQLEQKFPKLHAIYYTVNAKWNDSIADLQPVHYAGENYITEELDERQYRIGPKSFFQTNSVQAAEMYRKIAEFAGLTGKEVVYDLYSGTGSIAIYLAGNASQVIGVEYVEEAVADAEENARLNDMDNTAFFAGDMKDILQESFFTAHGKPDVIIADPPRAGMHASVVEAIRHSGARRFVYVSCNPATQARDIQLLGKQWQVAQVQPVDMFPHTHHVENIVLLENIH